jgi:cation-transporting ATPase 13A1
VKQGDQQMTVFGMFIACCFLWISRAEPLEKLSARRPQAKVFCAPVMVSLALQFAVHLGSLVAAVSATQVFIDKDDPAMELDGDFKPNVINTVVFLLSRCARLARRPCVA